MKGIHMKKTTLNVLLPALLSVLCSCSMFNGSSPFTRSEKADYHTVCNGISSEFNRINDKLTKCSDRLTENNSIRDEKARLILDDLRDSDSSIVSVGTINSKGKLEAVQPSEYSAFEGKSLIKNQHAAEALKTGKPAMSDIYNSKIGTHIVEFLYPVHLKGKKTALLSMLFRYDDFIENAITDRIEKDKSNIMVMQKNGIVLFAREKELIGLNATKSDAFSHYGTFEMLAKKITKSPTGEASYFLKDQVTGKYLKVDCIWTTTGLYGMEWRVVLTSKPLKNEKID